MPYREEKPLSDLIPPDRRRQKTIALVVVGMLMGMSVLYALQQATKETPTLTSVVTPSSQSLSVTLSDPDGAFAIPTRGKKTVVHVWLQACADCMPAFEAMKNLELQLAFVEADVFNVAYGSADPNWAAQYGVRKNLVLDHGGAKVVRPLGITSFTTVVFDEDGKIIGRDRPDRPGYVERLRALVGTSRGPLDAKDVEDVIASKHESIRERCWNLHRELSSADATVTATIDGEGVVVAAIGRGTHAGLTRCLEDEVKRWRFRPTGGASVPVDIPFKLRRDE